MKLRRIIPAILGTMLLCACGKGELPTDPLMLNTGGNQAMELIEVISNTPDLSDVADNREAFIPLTVSRAFIDGGGCARVIVHNNTDTPIAAYDLDILYFDENGEFMEEVGEYTVYTGTVPPRSDYGIDSYVGGSHGGSYIKAVIKRVTFTDATSWVNEYSTAQRTIYGDFFDIEKYLEDIAKNEANVKLAGETPYIRIDNMGAAGGDEIAARQDLKLVFTNTGDKTVREIKAAVAEFDRDNNKVDVTPQIYIGKNIRLASCTATELKPGESRSFSSSGFLESECFRINAIVTEITFADGTVWRNPYALDWLLWFM